MRPKLATLTACLLAVVLAACSSSSNTGASNSSAPGSGEGAGETITLLTHDAFAYTDSVLAAFEQQTGIKVQVSKGDDAVSVVNQAILTKGNPTADVLYGVDNGLLGRAFQADLFEPYQSPDLSSVDPSLVLDPQHRVTPIDESDVCINYDKRAFGGAGQPAAPASLDDLTKPDYKNQLVVENPATSTPGLAFLFATVKRYGANGYLDYWSKLKANGVTVADSWTTAYEQDFTAGGGASGNKGIVVSYATSPPADVVYATPAKSDTDVGVMNDGCWKQVEFAGILTGTKHEAAARKLIDFLISAPFQADMPLNMFVYPARTGTPLPDVFTKYSVKPTAVLTLDQSDIDANRDTWIKDWTTTVTG